MALTRLNKLLSQAGAASRRLADDLMQQGRVEVNGAIVSELGAKANPDVDDIRVDGRRLKVDVERRYILMNKPRGVLSTRTDPHQRRTVIDLLATAGVRGYFYPVGRLDYDSEGLILLTNDGEFAERVTHPRYELERSYEALVAGVPDDRDLERLRRGVLIDGRRTLPADVRLTQVFEGKKGQQALLELTLREGRNRQVRDMCSAVAHPVDRLRRTRIGSLTDRQLRPGQMRDLTPAEVAGLMGDRRLPQTNDGGNRKRRPLRPKPGRRSKPPAAAHATDTARRGEAASPKAPTGSARTGAPRSSFKRPQPRTGAGFKRTSPQGAPKRADADRAPSHAHRPRGAGARKPGTRRSSPPKRSPR